MADDRKEKNRRVKRIIGILLVIAVVYFVVTNLDLGWPTGFSVAGQGDDCVETKGGSSQTQTYRTILDVEDIGFNVLLNEDKAVLKVRSNDDVAGDLRVVIYCVDQDEMEQQTKTIDPGETVVYNFLGVPDCDLDYLMYPEMVTREREVEVDTEGVKC